MLHTKPQGHWPFGSGVEDFEGFLPYMGVVAILVMWPRPVDKRSFSQPMEAPNEIWLWLVQWFWRRSWKMVDVWRMDEGACLDYKLTSEPKGSGEPKGSNELKKDK